MSNYQETARPITAPEARLPRVEAFYPLLGPAVIEILRQALGNKKVYLLMRYYLQQEWPTENQVVNAGYDKAWKLRAAIKNGEVKLPDSLKQESDESNEAYRTRIKEEREKRKAERAEFLESLKLEKDFFEFLCQCFPHLETYRTKPDVSAPESEEDFTELNRHLIDLMKTANQIINEIRAKAYPGQEENLGLLNPTAYPAGGIPEVGNNLLGNGDVHDKFKFELQRQLLIVLLLLQLEEKTSNNHYEEAKTTLENIFREHLHHPSEKTGETKTKTIYSLHDSTTNWCLTTTETEPTDLPLPGTHWKKERVQIHESRDGAYEFITDYREKSTSATIIKMIAKALVSREKGQGDDITLDCIEDFSGFKFIVFSEDDKLRLYEELSAAITTSFEPGTVEIIPENDVGNDRGQSKKVRWNRIKVRFEERIVEIVIFNYKDYINYKYDVEGGVASGLAHSLFELRRMREVAALLFDEGGTIYDIDPSEVAAARQSQEFLEVLKLIGMNRFCTAAERKQAENNGADVVVIPPGWLASLQESSEH